MPAWPYDSIRTRRRLALVVAGLAVAAMSSQGPVAAAQEPVPAIRFVPDEVITLGPGQDVRQVVVENGSPDTAVVTVTSDLASGKALKVTPPRTSVGPGQRAAFRLELDPASPAASTREFTLVAMVGGRQVAWAEARGERVGSHLLAWWTEHALPALTILLEAAILLLAALFIASFLADLGSVRLFHHLPRPPRAMAVAGYVLILLGVVGLAARPPRQPEALTALAARASGGWLGWTALGCGLFALVPFLPTAVLQWKPKKRRRDGVAFHWTYRIIALAFVPLAMVLAGRSALGDGQPWSMVGLTVLGVLLVSWHATFTARLAIKATATATANATADGDLLRLLPGKLRDIGPDSPSTIRFVQGTDVSALPAAAVTFAPETRVLGALKAFTESFFPRSGYELAAEVEKFGDHWEVSAVLARGRGEVAAVTIDTRLLQSSPSQPVPGHHSPSLNRDPGHLALVGLAAWVLVTLSKELRRPQPGLYGATSWRSVCLQSLATEDETHLESREPRVLLARAVNDDLENLAARFNQISMFLQLHTEPGQPPDPAAVKQQLKELGELGASIHRYFPGSALDIRCRFQQTAYELYKRSDPPRFGRLQETDLQEAARGLAKTLNRAMRQSLWPLERRHLDAASLLDKLLLCTHQTPSEVAKAKRDRRRDRLNDFVFMSRAVRLANAAYAAEVLLAEAVVVACAMHVVERSASPPNPSLGPTCSAKDLVEAVEKYVLVSQRTNYILACYYSLAWLPGRASECLFWSVSTPDRALWALRDPSLRNLRADVQGRRRLIDRAAELLDGDNDDLVRAGMAEVVALELSECLDLRDPQAVVERLVARTVRSRVLGWLKRRPKPSQGEIDTIQRLRVMLTIDDRHRLELAVIPEVGPDRAGKLVRIGVKGHRGLAANDATVLCRQFNSVPDQDDQVTLEDVEGWIAAAKLRRPPVRALDVRLTAGLARS